MIENNKVAINLSYSPFQVNKKERTNPTSETPQSSPFLLIGGKENWGWK